MPDYDKIVDLTIARAPKDAALDPAAVMRVAADYGRRRGLKITSEDMAGLSDAARRRLAPQEQQGAASALAESAWRSGVIQPLGGIDARVLGNEPDIIRANDRASAQLEAENPTSAFIGGSAGAVAAPFVGTATGALLGTAVAPGPGTIIGGLGGGALASVPYTLGNDTSRELQGRGTGNRIGNAALETGFSLIPGMGPAAGALAKRVGVNVAEGALMGGGQSASQQGLDIATGDRQSFSAKEALLSGVGGATTGAALAPLGGAGDAQAAQGAAKTRQINMDQLLASGQEATALSTAQANDVAVRQRMGVQDAQQQAVDATREARMPGKLAEAEQLHRDVQAQDAKEAAYGANYESDKRLQQQMSERVAAARQKRVDDSLAEHEARMRDEEAQQQLDAEEHASDNVAYEKQYEDEARAFAAKHNLDPDAVVADVRAARATERQTGDPEVNKVLREPDMMDADTRGVAGRDDGLDAAPLDEPQAVGAARTEAERTQRVRENLRRHAENTRASEVQSAVDARRPYAAAPDERAVAKDAVRAAYKVDKLDRQTAKRLTLELQNREVSAQRTEQIRAAHENSVERLIPSQRTFGDDAESAYPTLEEQTGREFDRRADVDAAPSPRKLDLPDDAQKVVDDANLTDAEFTKLRDEGLAGWDAHADPEGAAINVKAAIEWVRKPPKKAKAEVAPTPVEPRYLIEPATGKPRLVTDRMSVDPKETVGYMELNPEQRNRVDVANKNLSRKVAGRDVTRAGAAINPAVAVVGAAKAVGRGVKAVAKGVPTEEIGNRWRSAREFMGDDAATRLKSSPDPEVRAVGTKFSNALGHSRDSQTRMNKSIDEATRKVSVMDGEEAAELRAANQPVKDANGNVSSKLYDVLSGKVKADTPLLERIKAGFTQSNDVTQQEMKAQGVKIKANARQGVDVVRQYMHPDADAALQGANKAFQKALIQKIADTNVHQSGPNKGQNFTFDEVAKDFAPSGEMGDAAVRREAMEQGRKYLLPPWVEAGGEMRQVLNLDPRNYIRSTANSAAQRVGTVRAFGPDATMESIRNSILLNSSSDHRALGRALDAYSGTSKELDLNDPRKFTRLVRSAKGILSALRTTATAPLNLTEPLNMVGQVPMHHAVIGAVNAAKHRGRAVKEGGMEADIRNRVDLRGEGVGFVDNTASVVRRGSLNNATNRMTHSIGYEAGRSWADGMRDAGKVSKGDAGYLEVNHIPEYIQDAFKNGHATDADVMHVAKAVGENLSGRKGSMAESGRLSRQEMVKTWGPMFLQYGENRVRNVMRSWDAIKSAAQKGDYVTAGRLFGSRLTGTVASAAAATAVGQMMRYGVEGLGMSLDSGELKPFLGNMLGGGASDIAIRATQDDDVGNLVASLMWPVGAAADAWDVATGRKGVTDAVPAAARIRDTVEGRDVAGDKAYSLYWKAQKDHGGRGSDNPTRAGARSDIRRVLMRKDYVAATKLINGYIGKLPTADKLAFLRGSRLLPGNGAKGLEEKRRLHKEIGATAYGYIAAHDQVLDSIIATYVD